MRKLVLEWRKKNEALYNRFYTKISKRVFNRTPIYVGNIIKSTDAVLKPKVYKNENGDFVPTPDGTKDMWLQSYTVIT